MICLDYGEFVSTGHVTITNGNFLIELVSVCNAKITHQKAS